MTLTVCVILTLNAAVMNLFFIKSQVVYEQDKLTASSIVQEIDAMGYDFRHKPIVFLGRYTDETVKEDWGPALGSFFSWDGGNMSRMVDFMNAEGYPVFYPSEEQTTLALQTAEDLPVWPEKGCIADLGSCIVVKLSEVDESWYTINIPGYLTE